MGARESSILIRLSDDEKKVLERKARHAGMSVSAFIRGVCIYSDDSHLNVIDVKPVRAFVFELTKQGTNLNQYMKFLNTHRTSRFDVREARIVLDEQIKLFRQGQFVLMNLQKELEKNNLYFIDASSDDNY
ncbi:plasmid mobilization protein [Streptococcus equi]|uniref:plasmid mobilization protein n=1 Tax=Streptococcus equi TaxID=1336 RepID=UPI0013DB39F3|nr:ribbon-helix-helix protein, CopG family [Streptococcus equi]